MQLLIIQNQVDSITVSNIMAKRTDAKGTATRSLIALVIEIK